MTNIAEAESAEASSKWEDKAEASDETDRIVMYLKVLADKSRLRVLGLLAEKERTVKELAGLLELKEPTISSHLAMLKAHGIAAVRQQGTSRYYSLKQDGLHSLLKEIGERAREGEPAEASPDEFARQVLRAFFDKGKLKEIPTKQSKLLIVLDRLAQEFEQGRFYTEQEVNAKLKVFHPDCATLRRQLVDFKRMARKDGTYWRVEAEGDTDS